MNKRFWSRMRTVYSVDCASIDRSTIRAIDGTLITNSPNHLDSNGLFAVATADETSKTIAPTLLYTTAPQVEAFVGALIASATPTIDCSFLRNVSPWAVPAIPWVVVPVAFRMPLIGVMPTPFATISFTIAPGIHGDSSFTLLLTTGAQARPEYKRP